MSCSLCFTFVGAVDRDSALRKTIGIANGQNGVITGDEGKSRFVRNEVAGVNRDAAARAEGGFTEGGRSSCEFDFTDERVFDGQLGPVGNGESTICEGLGRRINNSVGINALCGQGAGNSKSALVNNSGLVVACAGEIHFLLGGNSLTLCGSGNFTVFHDSRIATGSLNREIAVQLVDTQRNLFFRTERNRCGKGPDGKATIIHSEAFSRNRVIHVQGNLFKIQGRSSGGSGEVFCVQRSNQLESAAVINDDVVSFESAGDNDDALTRFEVGNRIFPIECRRCLGAADDSSRLERAAIDIGVREGCVFEGNRAGEIRVGVDDLFGIGFGNDGGAAIQGDRAGEGGGASGVHGKGIDIGNRVFDDEIAIRGTGGGSRTENDAGGGQCVADFSRTDGEFAGVFARLFRSRNADRGNSIVTGERGIIAKINGTAEVGVNQATSFHRNTALTFFSKCGNINRTICSVDNDVFAGSNFGGIKLDLGVVAQCEVVISVKNRALNLGTIFQRGSISVRKNVVTGDFGTSFETVGKSNVATVGEFTNDLAVIGNEVSFIFNGGSREFRVSHSKFDFFTTINNGVTDKLCAACNGHSAVVREGVGVFERDSSFVLRNINYAVVREFAGEFNGRSVVGRIFFFFLIIRIEYEVGDIKSKTGAIRDIILFIVHVRAGEDFDFIGRIRRHFVVGANDRLKGIGVIGIGHTVPNDFIASCELILHEEISSSRIRHFFSFVVPF